MQHSFEYCALRYLLLWEQNERQLHAEMKTTPSSQVLRKSLQYFKISRNFKGIGKEEQKVASILMALSYVVSNATLLPIERVITLAGQFETDFGTNNISAASKLLWLIFRDPYIIYDDRAMRALRRLGYKLKSRDYVNFCEAWQAEYKKHEAEIKRAAELLTTVHPFFTAWHKSKESIAALARESWFLERLFDIYLWELGGR